MGKTTKILGISAYYHDSAACLVIDGKIKAAAQEERFTRKKHDPSFPVNAIRYCLDEGETTISSIDNVVFYEKPFVKFERLLETYLGFAPRGFRSFIAAMPVWLKEKLFLKHTLQKELKKHFGKEQPPTLFAEHHQSHAASAFYPSPFQEAAVLCLDGVGEWTTTSAWHGEGNELRPPLGDTLPTLSRTPLLCLHLLYRLQGQLRRVQGHGSRPLRAPYLCPDHPGSLD